MVSGVSLAQMNIEAERFWELIEPEHQKARAFCRKLMGNREDGDDLYQDSLVCALTGFCKLREIEAVRPWFYRIVVNQFKNRRRSGWWKIVKTGAGLENHSGSYDPDPAYTARRRLEYGFKALSGDDCVLVTLCELQGWNFREISELTGRSEGNLRVRLSRARKKIKKTLIKKYGSSSEAKDKLKIRSEDSICVVSKSGKN